MRIFWVPRGRGNSSIGGRGNETADEWCPSPDILGNESLDVHEDNEEHVEHVTDSSQNQAGSNVVPSTSLPKLWLIGGVFYDPAISRHAVKLFKTMFKGAYATWTQVPQDHRDRCFNRFGENEEGRKAKLVELHTKVHTKKVKNPGEPGSSEILEFVDPKSKQRLDEYSRIISEKHMENAEIDDENGSKSPPDDYDFWKGIATSKGGVVLGAGLTTDSSFVLTGTPGSGSIYGTRTCSPYEEIRILKKQNDELKKKMEDERADAEAQRAADLLAWHKTLNDRLESFAQNYPPRTAESDPGPS